MKVWDRRFPSRDSNPDIEAFNQSIDVDSFLYADEITASLAYAEALHRASILDSAELKALESGLSAVKRRIEAGEDLSGYEDIHTAVELLLIEEIGEAGKKLHTGRSRNEQVVTDEKLYLKRRAPEIRDQLLGIQTNIIRLAERHHDAVMPGYTHLQQGQCVLFAHYIMALFWQVERGKSRLNDALNRLDTLPLGVGALGGSTVALDRRYIAERLGFSRVSENSMDTVADRGFILDLLFALAHLLLDIGRFAEDFILFSSQEFGYLSIDDSIATSSSLMPQKKNPDIFELIRASAGRPFAYASQLFIALKGLPMTYNKDLQEDKVPLFRGIEESVEVLKVFRHALTRIQPNPERMRTGLNPAVFATDLVDHLTERGMPFREAHGLVGEIVAYAENEGRLLDGLSPDELRSFSAFFEEKGSDIFDPDASVKRKKTEGSTHPIQVKKQIEKAKRCIQNA